MEEQLKLGKLLKAGMAREYTKRFKDSTSVFVTDFSGLTNKELEELRRRLKPFSAKYIIVKNSLCRFILKELKMVGIADMVEGSCALSYGKGDPISISKVLVGFAKNNKNLKLKGGYLDGETVSVDVVKELAVLPGRDVLIARLLSCLNSPISSFAGVCSGIVKNFVYVLNEITKTKQAK